MVWASLVLSWNLRLASGLASYREQTQGRAERRMHARNFLSLVSLFLRLCRYSFVLRGSSRVEPALWKENARGNARRIMLEGNEMVCLRLEKGNLPSRTKRDKMDVAKATMLFWYFSLAFGPGISLNFLFKK